MKLVSLAAAALLYCTIGWFVPASAQGVPGGSYLQSCTDIGVRGNALAATCQARDGRPMRNELVGVGRCVGDIGNNNGVLQCNARGGGVLRGTVIAERGPPPPAGPPPGYGAPNPRCHELHDRAERLRYRRDQAFDPYERERIERRLHEVHRDMWYAGCRYD